MIQTILQSASSDRLLTVVKDRLNSYSKYEIDEIHKEHRNGEEVLFHLVIVRRSNDLLHVVEEKRGGKEKNERRNQQDRSNAGHRYHQEKL